MAATVSVNVIFTRSVLFIRSVLLCRTHDTTDLLSTLISYPAQRQLCA